MKLLQGKDTIAVQELDEMSKKMFYHLVKAVVDIEQKIMMVDAEMHADEEVVLLEEHESLQSNLWGINLYPAKFGTPEFIEFDSIINIRGSDGNFSRGVENIKIQNIVRSIVDHFVRA
jgi:hypothetical protein